MTDAKQIAESTELSDLLYDGDKNRDHAWREEIVNAVLAQTSCDQCEITVAAMKMLCDDNNALKKAGNDLSIAAEYVAAHYDGLHRLRLAIAAWNIAIANEGGRAERYGKKTSPMPAHPPVDPRIVSTKDKVP